MGRYYNGDIEGKFWFAVQASDDAAFFGGDEYEVTTLNYHFEKDNLPEIKNGLDECKKKLGKYKAMLDKFFKKKGYHDDGELAKYLEVDLPKARELVEWYARLELGKKIYDKVKETGSCDFEAET